MATHHFVIAAERWKATVSGKPAIGPRIQDTGDTTSGILPKNTVKWIIAAQTVLNVGKEF